MLSRESHPDLQHTPLAQDGMLDCGRRDFEAVRECLRRKNKILQSCGCVLLREQSTRHPHAADDGVVIIFKVSRSQRSYRVDAETQVERSALVLLTTTL